MTETTVTSKGQVTIPLAVRKRLGIRQGSRLEFQVVDDHVELRVVSSPFPVPEGGFGLLKSRRKSVPSDYDPATLFKAGQR